LPDGVTLTASLEDGPATRVTISVPEGTTKTLTLVLPEKRPPLPVRVRDDRGYPIDTAQVTACSLEPGSPLRATSFTNAGGETEVASARGLPLRLEVRAPGHATSVVTVETTQAQVEVSLAVATRATGEVRASRGGGPVANAEVGLYTDGGVYRSRTDRNGEFSFSDLAPGRAQLRVLAVGYATLSRDVEIEQAGVRPMRLPRLELAEEGVVSGQVVGSEGDPVPGARVAKDQVPTYLAIGPTPSWMAITDANGRFRLGGLGEGTVALEAYSPEEGRSRIDGVRVIAGRTTDGVRITMGRRDADEGGDRGGAGGVAVTLGETSGEPREVVIVSVAEGSEAERAGLLPDDTILAIDGASVGSIGSARARLNGALSTDVVIRIQRADKEQSLRVARERVRR
jgi:hypothetical protein